MAGMMLLKSIKYITEHHGNGYGSLVYRDILKQASLKSLTEYFTQSVERDTNVLILQYFGRERCLADRDWCWLKPLPDPEYSHI